MNNLYNWLSNQSIHLQLQQFPRYANYQPVKRILNCSPSLTLTLNLLSKVCPDGEYRRLKRDSEKLMYISMVATRAFITFNSAEYLSRACTIAIRYSAVRRQGRLDER